MPATLAAKPASRRDDDRPVHVGTVDPADVVEGAGLRERDLPRLRRWDRLAGGRHRRREKAVPVRLTVVVVLALRLRAVRDHRRRLIRLAGTRREEIRLLRELLDPLLRTERNGVRFLRRLVDEGDRRVDRD